MCALSAPLGTKWGISNTGNEKENEKDRSKKDTIQWQVYSKGESEDLDSKTIFTIMEADTRYIDRN